MQSTQHSLTASIKRTDVFQRLKGSAIRDLYWQIAGRRWIEARRQEVDFYGRLLDGFRRGDLIFDIGANDGSKTDVFLRLGARVVAVDPDDHNQDAIRNRFIRYRLRPWPVVVIGAAVSDSISTATMFVDGPGSA